MAFQRIGTVVQGVTGPMGYDQHRVRWIAAIRAVGDDGGGAERRWIDVAERSAPQAGAA